MSHDDPTNRGKPLKAGALPSKPHRSNLAGLSEDAKLAEINRLRSEAAARRRAKPTYSGQGGLHSTH